MSVIICGQEVGLVGKCVRGPLPLLERITLGGWDERSRLVAHRWRTSSETGLWHEAEFRTVAEAKAAFARLAEHPAAISVGEWFRRAYTAAGR